MKLIVISPEQTYNKEADYVNRFFELGLTDYHIRKPFATSEMIAQLIREIAPEYLNRIVLHQSHELIDQWQLKGVHYTEKEREKGVITKGFKSTGLHLPLPPYHKAIRFDRLLISPVFNSISKQGYQAKTLDGFIPHQTSEQYALGGITPNRIKTCIEWGFDGVAVLGYIWNNMDPLNAFKEVKNTCL